MSHQATSHTLLDDISAHMPILMLLNNMKYKSKDRNKLAHIIEQSKHNYFKNKKK